jgi:hypothetical protein
LLEYGRIFSTYFNESFGTFSVPSPVSSDYGELRIASKSHADRLRCLYAKSFGRYGGCSDDASAVIGISRYDRGNKADVIPAFL